MLGSFSNQPIRLNSPCSVTKKRNCASESIVWVSFERCFTFFLYEMFFGDLTFFRRWNFYGSDGVRIRLRCLAELIKCSYFVFEGFLARCFVLTWNNKGAGPGQVQHVQHGFQRLALQHASENFVKIKRCGWLLGIPPKLIFSVSGRLFYCLVFVRLK